MYHPVRMAVERGILDREMTGITLIGIDEIACWRGTGM
jgi:hypothetical protein